MVISRRTLIAASAATAWTLHSPQLLAQSQSDLLNALELQALSLAPSRQGLFQTTNGFEALAKDPSLHLNDLRKSTGFVLRVPSDNWADIAGAIKNRPSGIAFGTAINLGSGAVSLDAHEVLPGFVHHVIFFPEPGKYVSSIIDIDPDNFDPTLDLVIGKLRQPSKVEDAGVRRIEWGKSSDTLTTPTVELGFYRFALHATLGTLVGYHPRGSTKTEEGKTLPWGCKMEVTNPAFPGQSGGPVACHGKLVGITTAEVHSAEDYRLSAGTLMTPVEAVGVAFANRFPLRADRMGVSIGRDFLSTYKRRYPECQMSGG